jgi:hypothetical protein
MSLKLTEILPHVLGLIAGDAAFAGIPCIKQGDPAYNKKVESALANPGLAIVAMLTGGRPAEADSARMRNLDLENRVTLSVLENPVKNTTGLGAEAWVELILTHLPQSGGGGGPRPIRFDDPAYDLGPLRTGLTIYFVTLRIRSTQPLATA